MESWLRPIAGLFFPHTCAGCGNELDDKHSGICYRCKHELPRTGFLSQNENPVARIFWGRVPLLHAAACSYFTKGSLVQEIMHQVKYRYRPDAALDIGKWMGREIMESPLAYSTELMIPMPLHSSREQKRGYNQATLICKGIHEITGLPFADNLVKRNKATITQTKQHRGERWENMQSAFELSEPTVLEGKTILLVDDVITTGATIEALAAQLRKEVNCRISVLGFAYTLP
ncbi:ComF family protein [Flavihumibacter rivuli]|uniref:ComF family protein n=1 Tax=Flavihumibacter rivuli TaxID=2838156 RepID=UPI001BDF3B5B|nr:phosphoribosyltransferase family protein [Flavihumibacter rivuli]ULQ55158.1 ComF family protein [Flavihumibacter rivuli]